MHRPPANPKIYHITHLENLRTMVADGCIWSDRLIPGRQPDKKCIGLGNIKHRRLNVTEVVCHQGTKVGDYVPFYFCPRSVMLYMIYRGNFPGLPYTDGQEKIVHLQADLRSVVSWADANSVRWAFTTGNAGASYVEFFNSLDDLGMVNWPAVQTDRWGDPMIKEGKQAEYLLCDSLPFELIEEIGVIDDRIRRLVLEVLGSGKFQAVTNVHRNWYY
jgi:hypothetical protein